jgi:predicted GNAT family acetyltransferase
MKVRWVDAGEFRLVAGDYLEAREIELNLIWSALAQIRDGLYKVRELAVIEDAGRVVGTAVHIPPISLLVSDSPPPAMTVLVDAFVERGVQPAGVHGPGRAARAFAERWQDLTGRRLVPGIHDLVYVIDRDPVRPSVAGAVRRARAEDERLLVEWTETFWREVELPSTGDVAERVRAILEAERAFFWEDGGPVAMAWWADSTPNTGRIGFVFTPAGLRGRGYARAVTAAVTSEVLSSGLRTCMLLADERNAVSNRAYAAVGYRIAGRLEEYLLDPEAMG